MLLCGKTSPDSGELSYTHTPDFNRSHPSSKNPKSPCEAKAHQADSTKGSTTLLGLVVGLI